MPPIERSTVRAQVIRSDKDTHFTGGINQNAQELESLALSGLWGSNRLHEIVIESIVIQSDQALEWDLFIYSHADGPNADLDLDNFVDYVNFPAASGKQIGAAGQYYYASASGLAIPVILEDGFLNVGLVNRSAAAKNAGATGEVVVLITARPVFGM